MIYKAHIYSRLNYCSLVWGTLISQAETNKIKVLQNAFISVLTNVRLRQQVLSMYKVIKSIRFLEMVKLFWAYLCISIKKVWLPVPIKNYSYNTQIDQTP